MNISEEIGLIGRILLKVAGFFIAIILGVLLFITIIASFLKMQFNEFLLGALAQFLGIIFAAVIVFYLFEKNKIESHKQDIRNQIKILAGIFNELLILNGENVKIYGGTLTEGNLDALKKGKLIGHRVNKIHFQEYITSLDQRLLNLIEVSKLTRTLSYINDKIELININPKSKGVIKEAHLIIETLKDSLTSQIKELKKN